MGRRPSSRRPAPAFFCHSRCRSPLVCREPAIPAVDRIIVEVVGIGYSSDRRRRLRRMGRRHSALIAPGSALRPSAVTPGRLAVARMQTFARSVGVAGQMSAAGGKQTNLGVGQTGRFWPASLFRRYGEPEILPSSIQPCCLIGVDADQPDGHTSSRSGVIPNRSWAPHELLGRHCARASRDTAETAAR